MAHAERMQAFADIRGHLERNGSRNWAALRRRYDSMSPATWWRLVRTVKKQAGVDYVFSSRRPRSIEAVARSGVRSGRFDFLAALESLFADVERLRAHCLYSDGSLRNPVIFDRSIRTRLKLLKHAVKLRQQVVGARVQMAFYAALIDEIAAESPDLQRRLITRLRRFNREFDGGGVHPGATGSPKQTSSIIVNMS